jgi:hypothetical protein
MGDALAALTVAREAGVTLALNGDDIVARARKVPPEIVEALKAVKPDLVHLLRQRQAAEALFTVERPAGASKAEWTDALRGLRAFLDQGWADIALLAGWSYSELFNVPALWSQIRLTGAAWLIGKWTVMAIDGDAIIVKSPWSSSQLKFRRQDDLRQLAATAEAATKVLSESEHCLVEAIVAYMADKVEVSATPRRLLTVMKQEPLDRAAAISRFVEIDDALFARGVEMWADGGHIVLGHYWKGCPRRKRVTVPSFAATEAEVADNKIDDETRIARLKTAAEAIFGSGIEVKETSDG